MKVLLQGHYIFYGTFNGYCRTGKVISADDHHMLVELDRRDGSPPLLRLISLADIQGITSSYPEYYGFFHNRQELQAYVDWYHADIEARFGHPKQEKLAPAPAPLPQQLYLYVVRAVGTSQFKIGISCNPNDRISSLQTGSPIELKGINIIKVGSAESEKIAHKLLACWNSRGEWFDFGIWGDMFEDQIKGCETKTSPELMMAFGVFAKSALGYEVNVTETDINIQFNDDAPEKKSA